MLCLSMSIIGPLASVSHTPGPVEKKSATKRIKSLCWDGTFKWTAGRDTSKQIGSPGAEHPFIGPRLSSAVENGPNSLKYYPVNAIHRSFRCKLIGGRSALTTHRLPTMIGEGGRLNEPEGGTHKNHHLGTFRDDRVGSYRVFRVFIYVISGQMKFRTAKS